MSASDYFKDSKEDFFKRISSMKIYSIPTGHNDDACFALVRYELNARQFERTFDGKPSRPLPVGNRMSDFARLYNTTVAEMKQHWRCLEYMEITENSHRYRHG